MFKNIGKTIQILAFALAGLCLVGFILFGLLCLQSAFEDGVTEALQTAGIQAAITSFVLAILSPFLMLILYGFGTLILTAQKQLQEAQKTNQMLYSALSEGLLSDEIARKCGMVQAKLLSQVQAQAPQQKANARTEHAPVQRFVEETPAATPVAAPTPVCEKSAPVAVENAPIQEQSAPVMEEAPVVEEAPIAKEAPIKETPVVKEAPAAETVAPAAPAAPTYAKPVYARPATPISTAKPLSNDEETF